MCSLYSINNNSKFSGQSSFQVVLCAKGDSSSSHQHSTSLSSPACSSSSSAPCSPSRRKKMKGGSKSPILILTPSSPATSSSNQQEITALFSPPSFQSTAQSSSSSSTSPSSNSGSTQHHHHRANSNSNSINNWSSFSYQQQQRRRQGSNHGTSHWHQFHQHQHQHHRSLDASFEHDQENQHPYSRTYTHKRASFPIDQHSNHNIYNSNSHCNSNRSNCGANSNGINGRDTGNARSAQVLNPTNMQTHSKTFFPSQSTPTPSHPSTPLLLSTQQQQQQYYNHNYYHHNHHNQQQQQRRPVATQLADPAVISFAAAAAASVIGVGAGTSSTLVPSSVGRSPGSSPIRQPTVQGGSHSAWSDMRSSFPSDRALAAAAASPSSSTLPTMTGPTITTTTTTPTSGLSAATPVVAEKGLVAHGSQQRSRDRSPMASSVDSHSHDTFDSDEMDLQHPHSDSNNDSDASMTETDTLDHDPATALQSMQAIHPRHSLEQQKQQRSISYRHSLNHHFNHHFPLLNHPQASAPSPSPSASTAANTAAVAATAAAVAAAVASAAVASSVGDAESPLERKSHLRRKCDRLQVKNAALKATVIQVKSDLALERQKRSTVDQIYLNIRKDLNQRLESEEDKVLGLKADLEQMAAEMKELKDQLASAKSRYSPFSTSAHMSSLNSRSNNGYRIGYDSSAFSLTRGISALGGVHMPHSSSLIDGHDDSEEFLFSHSYSSSARHPSVSQPINKDSTLMSCSDDDNEDDDEEMEEEDESDDESGAAKGAFLFKQPPVSRRGSVASSITLRSLAEETIEEEEEEEDDDEELDEEDEVDSDREGRSENRDDADDSDAPRTMMEIILQRQQSRSPEDDMEDPPADANETFESMTQKVLVQAIHSRFTVAQAQLQIEELVVKYEAPFDKAVEALTQGILRWWETERMATGGSVSGGWGVDPVVINKESGEQASPKVAVEKRIESFFGPLLLQFVASIAEQKMLLEKLGEQAQAESEGRWLRNHNAILVALYKYDVLDGEAVLEWWRTLEEPQGVFGHGGNNLRSLNSRFVAWLEDEDDESDSESEDEEEDSDSDSSCSEFESSDSEDDDNDDDDDEEDEEETKRGDDSTETKEAMEQDAVVEAILDMAFPTTASTTTTTKSTNRRGSENSITSSTSRTTGNVKRRISFCTNNNLYYSQDGKVQTAPRKAKGGNNNDTDGGGEERVDGEDEEVDEDEEDSSVVKKKYDQCPPFKGIMDRDIEIGTMA